MALVVMSVADGLGGACLDCRYFERGRGYRERNSRMGRLLDIPVDVVGEYTGFHERRGHADGSEECYGTYGTLWCSLGRIV